MLFRKYLVCKIFPDWIVIAVDLVNKDYLLQHMLECVQVVTVDTIEIDMRSLSWHIFSNNIVVQHHHYLQHHGRIWLEETLRKVMCWKGVSPFIHKHLHLCMFCWTRISKTITYGWFSWKCCQHIANISTTGPNIKNLKRDTCVVMESCVGGLSFSLIVNEDSTYEQTIFKNTFKQRKVATKSLCEFIFYLIVSIIVVGVNLQKALHWPPSQQKRSFWCWCC